MKSKKSIRVRTRHSRSHDLESRIILISTATVSLFLLFVVFSLGSRNQHPEGSLADRFNNLRQRIRGWEETAQSFSSAETPDARNTSGYQFLWTKKFNLPEWSLNTEHKDRLEQIQKKLKLGRARFELSPTDVRPDLFQLRENLSPNSIARAEKLILPLLPGEKIAIAASAIAVNKTWKMRFRVLAATQDRLDAPLRMIKGFEHLESSVVELNPRGQVVDLEIPSSAEFARHGGKKFLIEWPSDASGLLSIEGFQPSTVESDNRKLPVRQLIIHLDSLDGSLKYLTQTLTALKKFGAPDNTQIHLQDVIPPSNNFTLSQKSFITGRYPLEVGATLRNKQLENTLSFEPIVLRKLAERGGAVRRLSIRPASPEICPNECEKGNPIDPWQTYYSTSLAIERQQEFSSSAGLLRNDEFMSEPGSLFFDLRFPAEGLRLNWTTPLESHHSLLRWAYGGIKQSFARSDRELKEAEKLAQVDIVLAKLVEAFLATSNHANVAIFLHSNLAKGSSNFNPAKTTGIVHGEALFNIFNFQISDQKDADTLEVKTPLSQMSSYKLFEKLTQSVERSSEITALLEGLDLDTAPITQLSKNEILTLTSEGWLMDPIGKDESPLVRPAHLASPEHIYTVQEKSNTERRKLRLHGLNILFPNRNDKDELVAVNLTTNLRLVACESANENAQADTREVSTSDETESMKNYRIVGRRSAQSAWHIHCLLEGRITTASRLRIVPSLNDMVVAREQIGLGEFALPIRGFLWRSPDTLELTGAQILDATLAVQPADSDAARQTAAVIWTDHVPHGLVGARAVFSFAHEIQDPNKNSEPPSAVPADRLSGK